MLRARRPPRCRSSRLQVTRRQPWCRSSRCRDALTLFLLHRRVNLVRDDVRSADPRSGPARASPCRTNRPTSAGGASPRAERMARGRAAEGIHGVPIPGRSAAVAGRLRPPAVFATPLFHVGSKSYAELARRLPWARESRGGPAPLRLDKSRFGVYTK